MYEPGIKIDEQSDPRAGDAEVRENLRFKDRVKSFDAFDFHDDLLCYQQIETVVAYLLAFIDHRINELPLELNARLPQLDCESSFVGSLKQAWAKLSVNFNCAADDSLGQFIDLIHS